MTHYKTSHVAYPYFAEARDAIRDADVDAVDLPAKDDVRDRALERVSKAFHEGEIGDGAWDPETEILSYPVARILVSILADDEDDALIEAYAAAEASTFRERFAENSYYSIDDVAAEFEIGVTEADAPGTYLVDVPDFLKHTPNDDEWVLSDRPIATGRVRVSQAELLTLIERAVADRIEDGLPHEVPDRVREVAEPAVASLRDELSTSSAPTDFDVVVPGDFPPCLSAALDAVRDGGDIPEQMEYALVAFLGSTGMPPDAIHDLVGGGLSTGTIDYVLTRIETSDGLLFDPPDCEAVDAYGWCDPDDRCESIDHPHEAYRNAVREE